MPKIIETPWKYGLLTTICFTILILVLYVWKPFHIADKHPVFSILFVLSAVYIMLIGFLISRAHLDSAYTDITDFLTPLMLNASAALIGVFMIVILIFFIIWLIRFLPGLAVILNWIFNIIVIVGVIGIFYLIFKPSIEGFFNPPSQYSSSAFWPKIRFLIGNLILYLPCLLIYFVDYVKEQWNITSKSVWILLFMEITLICLRFLIPYLFHLIISHEGTHLLDDPIYLNNERTLGTFENLHTSSGDDATQPNFKYHYSISAWFYINPQPPNTRPSYTKFTNILNYGDKPSIEFNGLKNTLRVQVKTSKNNIITIYTKESVPMQTWNNIVINYDGATMDVFLNGELVASKPNIAPFMTYENINVGAVRGIEGGICNVVYYNTPLSKGDITLSYKLLNKQSPPVL